MTNALPVIFGKIPIEFGVPFCLSGRAVLRAAAISRIATNRKRILMSREMVHLGDALVDNDVPVTVDTYTDASVLYDERLLRHYDAVCSHFDYWSSRTISNLIFAGSRTRTLVICEFALRWDDGVWGVCLDRWNFGKATCPTLASVTVNTPDRPYALSYDFRESERPGLLERFSDDDDYRTVADRVFGPQ